MSLHNIYYVENLLNRAFFPPAHLTRAPHKVAHSGAVCLCAFCSMYVCACVYWQEGTETQWEKCVHVSARPGWHSLAHRTPVCLLARLLALPKLPFAAHTATNITCTAVEKGAAAIPSGNNPRNTFVEYSLMGMYNFNLMVNTTYILTR